MIGLLRSGNAPHREEKRLVRRAIPSARSSVSSLVFGICSHKVTTCTCAVILGADSVPYGPSVVRDFQKNGYIVLASVFSGEAADDLERDTQGYVRALVLDAEEVSFS